MRRMFAVLAVCVAVAVLSGCGKDYMKSGPQVAKNWGNMVAEMNISPTFPPREDVQPGDIYTSQLNKAEAEAALQREGKLPISTYLGSISTDLQPAISDYYRQRYAFPATVMPNKPESGDAESPAAAPAGKTGKSASGSQAAKGKEPTPEVTDVFGPRHLERLPYVAFPEFTVSSARSAEVGALFPIEAVAASAGFFTSDVQSVSLKLENASAYGLPQPDVLKVLIKKWGGTQGYLTFPKEWEKFWPKGKDAYLVTEVYLVREIEASVKMDKSSGFAAAAQVGETNPLTGATAMSTEAANAASHLESLNKNLAALSGTGGRLQIMAASGNSVAMKRTLPYPVVVGFKYIRLTRIAPGMEGEGDIACAPGIEPTVPMAINPTLEVQ
ncbi:MAG TPA: hypothetical protein DD766_02110 [Desulfovibrio sp.]|nr:hypothetical protein [Desulfovibrio sp.]